MLLGFCAPLIEKIPCRTFLGIFPIIQSFLACYEHFHRPLEEAQLPLFLSFLSRGLFIIGFYVRSTRKLQPPKEEALEECLLSLCVSFCFAKAEVTWRSKGKEGRRRGESFKRNRIPPVGHRRRLFRTADKITCFPQTSRLRNAETIFGSVGGKLEGLNHFQVEMKMRVFKTKPCFTFTPLSLVGSVVVNRRIPCIEVIFRETLYTPLLLCDFFCFLSVWFSYISPDLPLILRKEVGWRTESERERDVLGWQPLSAFLFPFPAAFFLPSATPSTAGGEYRVRSEFGAAAKSESTPTTSDAGATETLSLFYAYPLRSFALKEWHFEGDFTFTLFSLLILSISSKKIAESLPHLFLLSPTCRLELAPKS